MTDKTSGSETNRNKSYKNQTLFTRLKVQASLHNKNG